MANIRLSNIIKGFFLIIKYYIAVGGIALNLKVFLNIRVKGEVFIYIKFFLMVKKHLRVLFFKFKEGGISIFRYNN